MADRAIPPQTAKIGSLVDIQDSEDPEGLRVFYYLVQDLKVRKYLYAMRAAKRRLTCTL